MKKKKIFMAFAMLLLTGAALSTASYAWFTANTKLELGELDVKVEATNGIQVSVDATNWKANLTTNEIRNAVYSGSANQFPATLSPVSTIGSTTAGIFDIYLGELTEAGTINLTKQTDAQGTTGKYMAFDLFVQATETKEIELLSTSSVTAKAVSGEETVVDKGLKKSVRVGFINKGVDATNTASLAYALNSTVSQTIWEPNADQHTDNAIGATSYENGDIVPAAAFLGAKSSGTGVVISNAVNFGTLSATLIQSNANQAVGFPNTTVFTVNPGINKVRVYVWIEGQDIDCENSASLGTGIGVKLSLNAKA